MRRTIVYVDGFNLYHAIDNLGCPALKWLDLRVLATGLLRPDETLTAVRYFSALATWRPSSLGKHRRYIVALEATGVTVELGQFKESRGAAPRVVIAGPRTRKRRPTFTSPSGWWRMH